MIVAVIIILGVLFLFVFPTLVMSYVIYSAVLVRTKPEKWTRECSIPEDEEYRKMFEEGMKWDSQYSFAKSDVDITSDGLHLAGEYFDFGFKKAVIIIPGRMESCLYSYYFAEPYRRAEYNVLVIDNRAHGFSEGKYISLGYKEYRDIIEWGKLLHELGNESVCIHGICIGASTALFAMTDDKCPEYFSCMVAEGMYTNFYESFKNHMKDQNRPLFPLLYGVMVHIRVFSGANVVTDGPIKRIGKLKKPILFLHSKEDVFSLPQKMDLLYDKCNSKKELVWFDVGAHSRIRINNEEKYDTAIIDFLGKNN